MAEVDCAQEELNSQPCDAAGIQLSRSPACRRSVLDVKPPMDDG